MTTITTRAGKGSPLTNDEVDANFTNLNDDKIELNDLSVGAEGAASGDGSVAYNNATGVFTYTPPADISGAVTFSAKAGEALTKGDVVYVSGVSGNNPVVSKADADDAAKMPAFGLAENDAALNAAVNVVTFGTLYELDTSSFSAGATVYVSTTAGAITDTAPTGESALLQNIGKVIRSHASAGSIKVGGAGRTNATPNLNDGNVFIGNSSNQAETRALVEADISDLQAYLTGNQTITLTGDASGSGTTSISVTVADDSHNHVIANVDGLQAALDAKLDDSQKGAANGLAELDGSGKVPSAQLPSYVDDVLEYANSGSFPGTGETGKIYIALDTNDVYRWTGSAYVKVSDAVSTADEANTLATARTISLAGDVTGSTSFDGSANVSITATVADDSHNHVISNVDGLQAALDGKVDDSQVQTDVPAGAVFTDTTYSVGDGGLTEKNFTTTLKNKLDGIESGATADQSASEILTAIKTVDGSGSGLDADLLDGQQGSYYYSPANAPDPTLTLSGDVTGSATFTNLGNATLTATVADDSHNHIIANVDGLQTALDGKQAAGTYNTIIGTDSDINTSGSTIIDNIFVTDGVITSMGTRALTLGDLGYTGETNATADQTASEILTAIKTVDGSGSGLDADTVDGIQASSFLRSDEFDQGVGLRLTGGSYSSTYDTVTTPLVIDNGEYAYFDSGTGYLRRLIGTTGTTIDIGQSGTGLIQQINFLPGTAGNSAVKVNNNTVWNAANDGSGSGLDADLLDGQQGSYYAAASSLGNYLPLSGGTLTGGLSVTNSSNITIGTYGTTDTGSLLLTGSTANKQAVLKCTNGNLHIDSNGGNSTYLNLYSGSGVAFGSGSSSIVAWMGSDGDLWKGGSDNSGSKYWHAGNDGSGSGLDADLLDGVHGSSFLRSDAADQKTSGTLRFNDNVIASFGSSDDWEFFHNGSHNYMDCNVGDLYIRQGTTSRYLFDVSSGNFHADGNIIAYSTSVSDERLKDDINTLEDPLSLIDELRGVTFTRKDQQEKSSGVIAQELEKVMPWAVKENQARILKGDETVYKTVEYDALSALFIESIKALKDEIADLKEQLENK